MWSLLLQRLRGKFMRQMTDSWSKMEFLCHKEIEKILKVILILVTMGFNKKKTWLHGSQVKVYGEIALL